MKTSTKIIAVIGLLIIIALLLFAVDYSRIKSNTSPIFCIQTETYDDGGSTEYVGLGYKIIKYVKLESNKVKYEIGTWFMKFDNPLNNESIRGNISPDVKHIEFVAKNIKTHLYVDNFNSPRVDIIKSINDISKYKENFQDTTLTSSLDRYTEAYFNTKVLVIVTIQETSGSTTNKIDRVSKVSDVNTIDIFVKRDVAEIGTDDMAMWHLLVELDKNDIAGIDDISVLDSTVMYQ